MHGLAPLHAAERDAKKLRPGRLQATGADVEHLIAGPFPPEGAHERYENRAFAGLQGPNPLLYRCFPLTCARSQE